MRIRQIEHVIGIAERGGVSAAASALRVPTSTVAQSLGALERELDLALFVRAGNQLHATQECRDLLPRLRAVLRSVSLTRASVVTGTSDLETTLTIGLVRAAQGDALMRLVARLRERRPEAVVRVLPLATSATEALADRSCDLVSAHRTISDGEVPDGLVVVGHAEVWAVGPPGMSLPGGHTLEVGALEDFDVIVEPDSPLERATRGSGIRRLLVEPSEAHLPLTLAGLGVSFVDAEQVATARLHGCGVRAVAVEPPIHHVVMFEPTDLTPLARSFVDLAASSSAATVGEPSPVR